MLILHNALKKYILASCLITAVSLSYGADPAPGTNINYIYTWTGEGSDQSWTNADNWTVTGEGAPTTPTFPQESNKSKQIIIKKPLGSNEGLYQIDAIGINLWNTGLNYFNIDEFVQLTLKNCSNNYSIGSSTFAKNSIVTFNNNNANGPGLKVAAGNTVDTYGQFIVSAGETEAQKGLGAMTLYGSLNVQKNGSVQAGTITIESTGNFTTMEGSTTKVSNIQVKGGNANIQGGSVQVGTITIESAGNFTTMLGGTVTATDIQIKGGIMNVQGGHTSTGRFSLCDSSAAGSTLNVTDGILQITGSTNLSNSGQTSFIIGHYPQQGMINHSGGTISAKDAILYLAKDGTSVVNISDSAVFNVKGLNCPNSGRSTINLGYSATDETIKGGRLNIGSEGIKSQQTYNLGNGTIGALDSWSSSSNMILRSTAGTRFDTTQQVLNEQGIASNGNLGSTISLSGILSGSGKLIATGKGTLILGGNNTYTGGTQIHSGILQANNTNALGNGHVLIKGGTLHIADNIGLSVQSFQIDIANALPQDTPYITLGTDSSLIIQEGGISININFAGEKDQEYTFNIVSDNSGWTNESFTFTDNTNNNWELVGFDPTTGNLTMKAIPEPSSALLGLLGLSGLLLRRKRKS